MNIISIDKEWSFKVSWYPALFRKAIPLSPSDRTLLELLVLNEGILEKERMGLLLGFGTKNDNANYTYQDPAEVKIFEILLQQLKAYQLITTAYDIQTHLEQVILSYWGYICLENGYKYTFHTGIFPVYDHWYVAYEESADNLFPFSKCSLSFSAKKIVDNPPYLLGRPVTEEAVFLLKKIEANLPSNDGELILIDYVVPKRESLSEQVLPLTINLANQGEEHFITISKDTYDLPELDTILRDSRNEHLYQALLLFANYHAILKNSSELSVTTLNKYSEYVDWPAILEDHRIEWSAALFKLLSNKDISNGSVWVKVVHHCPRQILISLLDDYKDFLNWLILTELLEVEFIMEHYSKHPWDTEILIKRASTEQLEHWLSSGEVENEYLEWSALIEKLSDSFITDNIDTINFDLKLLTEDRPLLSQTLLQRYPWKTWGWKTISGTYDILFLLEHIDQLEEKLELSLVIPRILNSPDNIFNDFLANLTFGKLLKSYANNEHRSFYANATSDVFLDKIRIEFLDKFNLAFWGDGNLPGLEANKNLIWDEELFSIYKDIVKSNAGKQSISRSITSLAVVKDNLDFEWDFQILSRRQDFIDDFNFIAKHKQNLTFRGLIYSIPLKLLQDELLYFKAWAEESDCTKHFVQCLQDRLKFLELLSILSIHQLFDLDLDWSNIINRISSPKLEDSLFITQGIISRLGNKQKLIKIVTQKLNLTFILENHELDWDWEVLTTEKLSSIQLNDQAFLDKYAPNLFWPHLIQHQFTVQDLSISRRLPEIAVYLAATPEQIQKTSWKAITERLSNHELWKAIEGTHENDLFRWDWDFISRTDRISHKLDIASLVQYSGKIQWPALSSNEILHSFWKFDHQFFKGRRDWLAFVLSYLEKLQQYWDFKALSKIWEITRSIAVISRFEDKWDWSILTAQSGLFTKKDQGKNIIQLNLNRLKRFANRIDWKVLSARYDITISARDFHQLSGKDWDFQALSNHPYLSLSIKILTQTSQKNWNWKVLTKHPNFSLSKDLLLGAVTKDGKREEVEEWQWIRSKDWDWGHLSGVNWLDGELIKTLQDKSWDWKVISENKTIFFDLSLLALLATKGNVNWSAVIKNKNTPINPKTLQLIELNAVLSVEDWQHISSHTKLSFNKFSAQEPPSVDWKFIDQYADFWNWNTLVAKNKIDITDIKVLRLYKEKLDWIQVSGLSIFEPTVEILEEFAEKLHWDLITDKIVITKEILAKFSRYLNWEVVSRNEEINFTQALIDRHLQHWDWHSLIKNVSVKEKREVFDYVISKIDENPLLELIINLRERASAWAGYVFHYTHLSNLISILKDEKIKCRTLSRQINNSAGNVWKSKSSPWKYTRFYFRPRTPSQFYNEGLGLMKREVKDSYFRRWQEMDCPKCPLPVFLKIDMYAFMDTPISKIAVSNGNMQKHNTRFGPIASMLRTFNTDDVFNLGGMESEAEKNAREQEFLIEEEVDLRSIAKNRIKILVPTPFVRDLLVNNHSLDKYKDCIEVNESLFNLKNRTVSYIEQDDDLHFQYPSSEGLNFRLFLPNQPNNEIGLFNGTLIAPPVDRGTYSILTFQNNIEISKRARFTITLHDRQPNSPENKQDWLIFSNDKNWEEVLESYAEVYHPLND